MTNLTKDVLNSFAWNSEEIKTLETIGYETIVEKFRNLTEKQFDAICKYFDGWLLGENKKDRLNYWMKQTGLTVEMINIWMTV